MSVSTDNAKTSGVIPALKTSASILTLITASGFVGFANAQTVILDGDNVTVTSRADGETISVAAGVTSTVDGAPVVVFANDDVTLDNAGTLATINGSQTVQVSDGTLDGIINNASTGVLNGDSRVVQIDGDNATLNNDGQIIGTGDQRNGTVYTNRTATDFTLNNGGNGTLVKGPSATIDAGMGNLGAGASFEGVAEGTTININNAGTIQGRGQAGAGAATAGDGIRFERTRVMGMLDGTTSAVFSGTINNSGTIASESMQGTTAGIRFVNGVSFNGTINNEEGGTISGAQNGLYFGNATPAGGGDFTGAVVNNAGTISSDSRALNIDGLGLTVNNTGDIFGTGNQRNGTVYADSTAQDFTFNNLETGDIDAGEGNEGSGFGAEISPDGNTFTLANAGDITGRGNALASTNAAGDGVRIGNVGNAGIASASITNSGTILSEGENGTVAGLRVVNGVGFQGTIDNIEGGIIGGLQNGVYFGDADHTGGVLNNAEGAQIVSLSRALNIDGTGLEINNAGLITGTVIDPETGAVIDQGAQRNGTVYSDSTAQGFALNNLETGVIDAGMGNEGAGFAAELSEAGNDFTIVNAGTIQGRGQAGAGSPLAGDGLRFERARVDGMLDGTTTGLFTGTITNTGIIASESTQGTTAGIRFVNGVSFQGEINNSGTISGAQNGVYFGNPTPAGGGDHTGGVFNNLEGGVISSDSRAFNIDGLGLTVNNAGTILGTGNQRNGTLYADGTAQNFTVNNSGTIDAGMGLDGSGFAAEIGPDGNTFAFDNSGDIIGRGQGAFSDGFRVGNGGNIGVATVAITNSGTISSESTGSGAVSGLRFVNGVSFAGTIDNSGTISGAQNGVYFGNPVMGEGADHSEGVFNNLEGGVISSDSRAFNIDGLGLTVNNAGSILGTGNQRNGTVYADGTADNFTFNNIEGGLIDAGMGNTGSGFGLEIGGAEDGANTFTLVNDGTIQGRGNAPAGENAAGDGIRIGNVGNIGVAEATITNNGVIASEGANGTVAGVRFVNGISFAGTFDNAGTITGVQNGVYFGNPVMGEGADHSEGVFNNLEGGVISSDSRAFNIDGLGLTVNNAGTILGTGNQRNGTLYADGTAQNFTVNNSGTIDAGMGLDGSGFAAEIGPDGNTFAFDNSGDIIGRGQGAFSDGFRVGNGGNIGVATVAITNSGTISSESTGSGAVSGLRFVNGVSFAGTIDNSGTISGAQNGVYFGNPVMGEGADHSEGVFNNLEGGVISSDSRAFNIDGLGLTVNNAGSILGTGDQRNGTVYSDATADAFTFNNLATGLVDAGAGNNGSGVSLQSGDVDGDTVTFSVTNAGTIAGRGDALPSGAAAGLRVFAGSTNVTVDGDITNTGTISSETAAAILIEGVDYTGTITNSGALTGTAAFDASAALGAISFVNNGGSLNGNFIGSSFTDTLTFQGASTLAGSILGDVTTTLDAGSTTTVSGIQSVEGDFTANGTLNFLLGADRVDVVGDSVLGANSIINIDVADDITTLALNTPTFVLTETGSFTNNGATVNVVDNELLVDFDVVFGSVAVVATAADLAEISADANISSFGGALTSAFAAGALDSDVANALNGAGDVTGFENVALSLLPTLNEGVTREVFEAHSLAGQRLERRLRSDAPRGVWVEAFGRTATRATDDRSTTGYSADTFGASIGADTKLSEQLTVGAAFNYANIDINSQAAASDDTDIDSFEVSAYAGFNAESFFANAQIGYVFGDGESTRNGATGPISGDFDVDGVTAEATAGFDVEAGALTVTPTAGLRFASLSQGQFTEIGGLNLDVDADSVQYLDLRVGANFAADLGGFKPFARIGYAYDVIGDARAFDVSFAGAASPFALATNDPSQSRFELGAGYNIVSGKGFTVGIEYDGEFANDYQAHGGFIRARVEF